jgi:hypothetical protein
MADKRFPWAKTFVLGFGFFGISIVWPLFNWLYSAVFMALALFLMSRVRGRAALGTPALA